MTLTGSITLTGSMTLTDYMRLTDTMYSQIPCINRFHVLTYFIYH